VHGWVWRALVADESVRLDPLDRAFARHAGECERRDARDPADLRMLLNVKEGMAEGYWWVTCLSWRMCVARSALRRGKREVTTNPPPAPGHGGREED
jgi:hypothetical protein